MSSPAKANSAATPAPPPYSGAGGKFRKKPVKRSQTTPYDRPATALRPTAVAGANDNKGWLSKIVDPASKIITAGAHKLFSSVFRKRLLPPPSHSPPVKEQQQQQSGSGIGFRISYGYYSYNIKALFRNKLGPSNVNQFMKLGSRSYA